MEEKVLVGVDVPWVAHLRQVVSEKISCLYISGNRSEEEKEYSDTHQVVSERERFLCFL
jgi:hypothetical protein